MEIIPNSLYLPPQKKKTKTNKNKQKQTNKGNAQIDSAHTWSLREERNIKQCFPSKLLLQYIPPSSVNVAPHNTKSALFTWIFVMMMFSFQCRWRSSFCLDGEAYWDIVLLFPRLLRQFPPPSMISTQRWQNHGPAVNLCNGPLYRSTDGMTSHGWRVSIFWLFQFSSMWICDLE